MKIVPYAESAFSEVVALWDACGLNVPYNDPAQDIALVQASRQRGALPRLSRRPADRHHHGRP